jgi:hypothetical protein
MLHLLPGVVKCQEPVGVQALGPELAVETFDERVVGRLPGPCEVKDDVLLIGAEVEADELRALVDTDRLRVAVDRAELLEGGNNVFAAMAEMWIDGRRGAEPGADDGQGAQLPSRSELVVHEVYRPGLVASGRRRPVLPELRLHAALRRLVPELKAQLVVKPARSLPVDGPALAQQEDVYATVPIPHARLADRLDPLLQADLIRPLRLVGVEGPVDPQRLASLADRHLPRLPDLIDKLAAPGRPQSFFGAHPAAWPYRERGPPRCASAWRSHPRAAAAASPPTASGPRSACASCRTSLRKSPPCGRPRRSPCRPRPASERMRSALRKTCSLSWKPPLPGQGLTSGKSQPEMVRPDGSASVSSSC